MSRIYDQLTLPKTQNKLGKTARAPFNPQISTDDQLDSPSSEHNEQNHPLQLDELNLQASLHMTTIERAHKRTAEEKKLADKHSIQLAEELRLEMLARERAEAEQAERIALVARVETERQLIAQLEIRLEQEKIERAQAAQRAAQELQLRQVIAERKEQENLLQAEENAAQIEIHKAALAESREHAANELLQAQRLATQHEEELRLEALARERAQSEENERIALASRIEIEQALITQIELRLEQEKIERAQANKKAAHEEQLRLAVTARESHEHQLRLEESAALAESHKTAIEEARKRAADELRRTKEVAAQLEEEERLEALAQEKTRIEQTERTLIAARIEAERRLTAQIEARIEQERLELEETMLRDSTEEKLRLAAAEREAMERRLQADEQALLLQRHEAQKDAAYTQTTAIKKRSTRQTKDTQLKADDKNQFVPPINFTNEIQNNLTASIRPTSSSILGTKNSSGDVNSSAPVSDETNQAPSRSIKNKTSTKNTIITTTLLGLNRRHVSYLAATLLTFGVLFFMAGGSHKIENKPVVSIAQPKIESTPTPVTVNAPAAKTLTATAPIAQKKADIPPIPEAKTTQIALIKPVSAITPEIKTTIAPVTKSIAAVDKTDHTTKPQQHGETEIRHAVMQWADAWSRRDATAYLSAYSLNFVPPDGMKRADWEEQRKSRLSKYHSIKITVRNLKISNLNGNSVTVNFAQDFKADNHTEIRTQKELFLRYLQGHWLIVSEKNS